MAFLVKTVVTPKTVDNKRMRPTTKRTQLVPRAASENNKSRRETLLSVSTLPVVLPALGALLGPFPGDQPQDLGVQSNGGLKGCPDTPNCLSSSAPMGDSHYTAGLSYTKSSQDAIADVSSIINNYPLDLGFDGQGAAMVSSDGSYVYANFTSKLFGFVDDVEFL
eukprot:CAMPEP_0197851560 /NCGR_PEP_ID=MMETSP1438-20131217/18337_1 /TAXON_ID=1461541 /ORGANISM="Pterosperma sp., Strain CCMP1384" /LENGTH=164 /DNA_ID=CAMNT_0043465195 /DNA_START=143 /DNA_END=633 /DNA_ORIENTATION=-